MVADLGKEEVMVDLMRREEGVDSEVAAVGKEETLAIDVVVDD